MADTDDNTAKPGAAPRVEMWTLDRLHPYANNPRRNDDAVPALAESIATFGFKVPIVARPDGEILAGHTRFKAALRLGLKEVPVLVADDLDDMKAKAFRLADNKVAEAAEWDTKALAKELEEIDFDMEAFGFELDVDDGEEKQEQEAEVPFREIINEEHNFVMLYFDNEVDWLQACTVLGLQKVRMPLTNSKGTENGMKKIGIARAISGAKAFELIKRHALEEAGND